MSHSAEIENIVEQSVQLAQSMNHEYVTTEHLFLALLRHEPFRRTLNNYGVEVDRLDQELTAYLNSLQNLKSTAVVVQPRKTQALERIFNRANVQVMFTGRRAMSTADVFLSIMAETNSHAHYFILKFGVKKKEFIALGVLRDKLRDAQLVK